MLKDLKIDDIFTRILGKAWMFLFALVQLLPIGAAYGQENVIASDTVHVCRSYLLPIDLNETLGVSFALGAGKWYNADGTLRPGNGNIFLYDPTQLDAGSYLFYFKIAKYENDCLEQEESCYEVIVDAYDVPVPLGDTIQRFCYVPNEQPTLALLDVVGLDVQFYDSLSGGSALPLETMLENKVYYASQTEGACGEGVLRLPVRVELQLEPNLQIENNYIVSLGSYDLNTLNITDLHNTAGTYSFHSKKPEHGYDMSNQLHNLIIKASDTIYVMKTTEFGCFDIESVLLVIENELDIPDGFSPNGDGINDLFVIEGISKLYPDASLKVYNRWGMLIYHKEQYGNEERWGELEAWWNGVADASKLSISGSGSVLPVGTYLYTLVLNDAEEIVRKGTIFLNR